jgi:hypothetical protein
VRPTTKIVAAVLPLALLAATVAAAAPAAADTIYDANVGFCFELWNNTGWALQAQFAGAGEDGIDSRSYAFAGSPAQLAPGAQTQVCTGYFYQGATLQYSNAVETFDIDILTNANIEHSSTDAYYVDLSSDIVRHVGSPDTFELRYTPPTDAQGNYTWSNANTFDFPDVFTLSSPQGSHQQSCSTLSSTNLTFPGLQTAGFVTLQAWNDSSGANAWGQATTAVSHLRLTTDGNLELVNDQTEQVAWSSDTAPNPGHAYPVNLKLQTDGNLALYGADGHYMWDAKMAPVCP